MSVQNTILPATLMRRLPVLEPLMRPKDELPYSVLMADGAENCGVLVACSHSLRSSRLNLSVRRTRRKMEASRLKNLGPEDMYLPTFPWVPGGGFENTLVLNQGVVLMPWSFCRGPFICGKAWLPGVLKD